MRIKSERAVKAVTGLLGTAFWVLVAVALLSPLFSWSSGNEKVVDYYVWCVDGTCTPIPPDEIKIIYKTPSQKPQISP